MLRFRTLTEHDYDALAALDLAAQRALDPAFDTLPERERESRLSTSLPALKFYERSEHSFLADDGGEVRGFVFAQSVWQGDRPLVFVRTLALAPGAAPELAGEAASGLLHAVVKSAYDTAVYEIHLPLTPELNNAARAEEARVVGQYGVVHLGTRAQTAPGERLRPEEGP
ncbi:DUF1999 domain-containing protein [Deinococcus sp. Leaf326]|uniref:DUF1999 domain-containing protein n=1 Tax=Deinococcus sp. Leaf326 TaxID=1736338 RepID=UPI0006F9F802|nr:DUF1999 domain-containing protein [Deinococcus sp. Leaf326]KQR40952.1 GNAT family acetyltransferase [Deinococcus sp. Leaf326]